MAARPRTLPAAVAPVLVGTALAGTDGVFHPLRFVAALLGALFIQVGTNLSNDYSDARRGADTEDRLGPVRVTAGGLVPPRQVLVATYVAFGLAVLVRRLPDRRRRLGAAARRRRVDPRRRALHGRPAARTATRASASCSCSCSSAIVAVAGSYFVQAEHARRGRRSRWPCRSGCSPRAILVVNNVRDIDTDRRAGKRTLAVRLGRERTRMLFAAMVYLAYLLAPVTWSFGPLTPWLLLPLAVAAARGAARARPCARAPTAPRSTGRSRGPGARSSLFCVLLSAGLLLS